jgi:transcription antitermination factor NusG
MDISANNLRWCAVQVRPHREVLVATQLRVKGYQEFLPVYRTRRQWSDRRKELKTPLFTGYVFCKIDTQIPWAIVSTPGVIRIVGTRKEIAVIPDKEIEAIRIATDSGKKVTPCEYARTGDRVRIRSGPLEGVEGIVSAYANQQGLVLSIDLIRSSMFVEVEGYNMVLVSRAPIAASGRS